MAIPNGTRFIGISQEVDLTERKSTLLNSLTEPYTFPDDFNASSYLSYAGTMLNFGSNQLSPLGGDTADFGTIKDLSNEHIGFVVVSQDCKVASLGWQWAANISITTAAGANKALTFKISTASVGGNMNNPVLWTDYYITTTVDTDTAPYPGFVEDVSALNINVPAGSVVAVTALSPTPFDNDRTLEANVSITLESV
jgi:hypothetical protein